MVAVFTRVWLWTSVEDRSACHWDALCKFNSRWLHSHLGRRFAGILWWAAGAMLCLGISPVWSSQFNCSVKCVHSPPHFPSPARGRVNGRPWDEFQLQMSLEATPRNLTWAKNTSRNWMSSQELVSPGIHITLEPGTVGLLFITVSADIGSENSDRISLKLS